MNIAIRCIIISFLLLSAWMTSAQQAFESLYDLSNKQFNSGNYDLALSSNLKALQFAEKAGSCGDVAYANIMVGKMHYYLKERRLALKNFFIAEKIIDSCHVDSLAWKVNHNIGAMYAELGIPDSALIYLNKALAAHKTTQRYAELAKINSVIGDLYLNQKRDYAEAEKHITRAEQYAKLSGDQYEIVFAKIKRGGLYRAQKKINRTLEIYEERWIFIRSGATLKDDYTC